MFRLHRVHRRYSPQFAVDVDLEIPRRATTVLLGPSGSGKSTLLRLLIALVEPDSGEVWFDGHPLMTNLRAARRRMGYVIQEGGLFPHLTAAANVALPARHRPRSEVNAHIRELAQRVRLSEHLLDQYPQELSGGQRQRVSLMRALILDPEVLLLDEPFGALDPLVRTELQQDLKHLIRTLDKTTVLVTHDLAEAAALADHIVLMKEGRIVQRGDAGSLLHPAPVP